MALFMFCFLIPFIFFFNLYGNIMIKAEYFQTDLPNSGSKDSVINKILDPLTGKQVRKREHIDNTEKLKCNLDCWYQMMAIMYLLLIYCQIVVFYIFACSAISYMKRFFLLVDDIPFEEQRRLAANQGGRFHPLFRRSFEEYMNAFNYSYYI